MVALGTRVQSSAALSLLFHGTILGLYFAAKSQEKKKELLLTKVEFIDLSEPAPIAPAQQAPKSLTDFLKMALPVFKKPEPIQPQDIDIDKVKKDFKDMEMPKLREKQEPLRREKALDLALAKRPRDMNLEDVSQKPKTRMETIEPVKEKAISLDAVGKVAAGRPAIDIQARPAPRAMADLPDTAPARKAAPSMAMASPAINLERRAVRPASSLPIGYSRGRALNLNDVPMAKPKPAALPPVSKAAREEALKSAGGSKKAVEISGPLAKRGVISAYMPQYPAWAREQGIEADVILRFYVAADGTVLRKIFVEKTSGYPKLDKVCMEAIKKWAFVALPEDSQEDQWGFVTFRFRLK